MGKLNLINIRNPTEYIFELWYKNIITIINNMKNSALNIKKKIYNNYLGYAKRYCLENKKDIDFSGVEVEDVKFNENLDVIIELGSKKPTIVIPKKWFANSF